MTDEFSAESLVAPRFCLTLWPERREDWDAIEDGRTWPWAGIWIARRLTAGVGARGGSGGGSTTGEAAITLGSGIVGISCDAAVPVDVVDMTDCRLFAPALDLDPPDLNRPNRLGRRLVFSLSGLGVVALVAVLLLAGLDVTASASASTGGGGMAAFHVMFG